MSLNIRDKERLLSIQQDAISIISNLKDSYREWDNEIRNLEEIRWIANAVFLAIENRGGFSNLKRDNEEE